MTLRLRLNVIITSLLALVLLVGVWLTIDNAREDVRAEVDSTASLALHLLDAEIAHYTGPYAALSGTVPDRASPFRLQSLGNVRHLRIEFFDSTGRLRDRNRPPGADDRAIPPRWFVRLLNLGAAEQMQTRRKVFAEGRVLGELVVTQDPSFELAEIWNDTVGLLVLMAVLFVVINLVVHWAVGRALDPVRTILEALTELERGRLEVRLPDFALPEMASIGRKFNSMAMTLQSSIERNRKLTQQIVRVQEDERQGLARDLHDEIGQCLSAISIDAAAIQRTDAPAAAQASAREISAVCRQVMDLVHNMLQRLRPATLEELGLAAALRELVGQWAQRHPALTLSLDVPQELGEVDDAVALAMYRAAQECLTNIARHAGASRVTMWVSGGDATIELVVEDDGKGFDLDRPASGFGLAGMRERVEGLGGTARVRSAPAAGTTVVVTLPRRSARAVGAAAASLPEAGR